MIEVYKYSGNSEDECRLKCMDELDVYNNEIIIKSYEENSIFNIDVIKKEDIKNFIEDYVKTFGKKFGVKLSCNIYEEENIFYVRIKSDNNSILIGKQGKTLNSLQYMIRKAISNQCGFNVSVNLDVSNYKKKIDNKFETEIKQIINEVMQSKIETKLEPMNSYKRRLVHSIASNYYNIETFSVGEEPDRYTIIKYVEK